MPTILQRKLATIREIKSVEPIPEADSIVKVTFTDMHWVCVMGKNENPEVGMKVVYFEIDAVLPDRPVFEFMRDRKFHVKTCVLRKQVSQGLAISINKFPELTSVPNCYVNGTDVTTELGVEKFDIPESLKQGDTKGPFPSFIVKTDEERAENIPNLEEILATHDLYASVKIDGTSGTFFTNEGEFGVCSRNLELKEGDNTHWNMAKKYNIRERLFKDAVSRIAIQGEIAGPGIQSNRAKLDKVQLFVFTAQNICTHERLDPQELINFIDFLNDQKVEGEKLQLVPSLGVIKAGTFKTLKDLEAFAIGDNVITTEQREGVVFRSMTDPNVSFKFVSPAYLLRHKI